MATMPKARPLERSSRLPVVEILHKAESPVETGNKVIGFLDDSTKAVTVYAGKNAFRIYQASTGLIGENSIGNLQGMVKSARWRTVFRVSTEAGEKIEVIAFLASLAENITKAAPEFEAISKSNDSTAHKCVRLTRLADAIGQRTAMGVFTAGVSTIYEALKGWCLIGSLAGGKLGKASTQCVSVLESADFRVKTAGKAVADFATQSNPILNTIDIVLSTSSKRKP